MQRAAEGRSAAGAPEADLVARRGRCADGDDLGTLPFGSVDNLWDPHWVHSALACIRSLNLPNPPVKEPLCL